MAAWRTSLSGFRGTQRYKAGAAARGDRSGSGLRLREQFSGSDETCRLEPLGDQRRKSVEKRIEELAREQGQLAMFDGDRQAARLAEQRILEEELLRHERHYEELRDQLNRERERVVDQLLPRRYAMRGDAQVFPVAVEIRLPQGKL
jgi:hypothetical protein